MGYSLENVHIIGHSLGAHAAGEAGRRLGGSVGRITGWRYKVSVTLAGKKEMSGSIMIALYGSNGNSKQYEIFKGSLKPDAKHMRDIDVDINVGKIQKVKFLWDKRWLNMFRYKLGASKITVQTGEDGTKYHFCSGDTVKEHQLQSLLPC
ncbi:Pancreatic lipase-related protein 2 [Myotis brandtii]|uniref:Pancreatic lipase-related protein 2 n=1 Tax=Myotis brandtii TaxID=109478 RepID=S7PPY0_MYOBR|nr:Pancreatic lipase-related protein 2 [Myotis brandtii]